MTTMRWALSDGTTVTSNGSRLEVAGESPFAEHLRQRLDSGDRILVPEGPAPTQMPLEPARARNVDAWLDDEIRFERVDVVIASRPKLEPLEPPSEQAPEGTVY